MRMRTMRSLLRPSNHRLSMLPQHDPQFPPQRRRLCPQSIQHQEQLYPTLPKVSSASCLLLETLTLRSTFSNPCVPSSTFTSHSPAYRNPQLRNSSQELHRRSHLRHPSPSRNTLPRWLSLLHPLLHRLRGRLCPGLRHLRCRQWQECADHRSALSLWSRGGHNEVWPNQILVGEPCGYSST
jgi:hypothetical protein